MIPRREPEDDREHAFDRLYEEHVDRVYGLCLRMSGDAREAESLTQDVFVRAWTRLETVRQRGALGSWLYRLAVNVVLHARRTDRRRWSRVGLVEDLEALEGAARTVPVDERMDLERAIASLPPKARLVLLLHDVEGYDQASIAAMTGIAVGTVKSQLHRARKLLRERLER
ncbi:MAG TPA: RNA polymerase sigma factor [Longimicrobiaceae bacterium]|nr:RNA polymerase sigma factor [Longimicrobiaceae bacterium]